MKESTLIETVDALFVVTTLFLINGLSIYVSEEHSNRMTKPQHKQERFQVREREPEPIVDYKRNLKGASDFKERIDSLDVFIDSIEYVRSPDVGNGLLPRLYRRIQNRNTYKSL